MPPLPAASLEEVAIHAGHEASLVGDSPTQRPEVKVCLRPAGRPLKAKVGMAGQAEWESPIGGTSTDTVTIGVQLHARPESP